MADVLGKVSAEFITESTRRNAEEKNIDSSVISTAPEALAVAVSYVPTVVEPRAAEGQKTFAGGQPSQTPKPRTR